MGATKKNFFALLTKDMCSTAKKNDRTRCLFFDSTIFYFSIIWSLIIRWLFMIIHDYSWLFMIIHDYSGLFRIIQEFHRLWIIELP